MRSFALLLALVLGACATRPADDPMAGFHAVHAPPLRILGDEAPAIVERRASLLTATATQLTDDLFDAAPAPTLDVWLLRDADSTAANTQRLFGHDPDPPAGFYSVADHAIVVDVSRGDRAPVHYLVHAYVYANLPGCPVWLDEGLAALYEGREDTLDPAHALPSLRALLAMDQATFHGEGVATHRPLARELCAWLQHQGKLRAVTGRLDTTRDPTGYETLLGALAPDGDQALQEAWERWLDGTKEEG